MPQLNEIGRMVGAQIFDSIPVPDAGMTGKTIIVTGGNSGLGLEACKHLVRLNVGHLIIACRDLSKGGSVKQEIISSLPAEHSSKSSIDVWQIDLSNFASVIAFAKRCNNDLPRLDAIIANAGIEVKEFVLAENFEQTLTINVLSTFLLGLLVLEKLHNTGKTHRTETYYTVVGSAIQIFAPHEQLIQAPEGHLFESLSDEKQADMENRYYLSKLMVMQCVQELAKRTSFSQRLDKVVVNCVSPGFCKTNLYSRFQPPMFTRVLLQLIGSTAERGSRTLVHGIVTGKGGHGKYLSEGRMKVTSAWIESEEGKSVQEKVWRDLVGVLERVRPGIDDLLRQ